MELRRRFEQVITLKDQLIQQAQNLRMQAEEMPAGIQRDELLKLARQEERTADAEAWLASPGLRPPN
jgi:hypothetical protein